MKIKDIHLCEDTDHVNAIFWYIFWVIWNWGNVPVLAGTEMLETCALFLQSFHYVKLINVFCSSAWDQSYMFAKVYVWNQGGLGKFSTQNCWELLKTLSKTQMQNF